MEYRNDPTRVTGRSGRSVLATALTVAFALGGGIVALSVGGGSGARTAGATEAGSPALAMPSAIGGAARVAARSPTVRCHDVPSPRCARVAAAAVDAIVDPTLPPATTVDVWATLLCGSTFDCPPYHLADRLPAGSAVIVLASSMVLWVNVTEIILSDTDRGSVDSRFDAWVIPSGPPP
jgi:hypothetical protein